MQVPNRGATGTTGPQEITESVTGLAAGAFCERLPSAILKRCNSGLTPLRRAGMGETQSNGDGSSAGRNYHAMSLAVMVVLALLSFLVLAHFAVGANGLTELDLQVSNELKDHARASPLSTSIFDWLTFCGNTETLAALSVAVAIVLTGLMLCKRCRHGMAAF